MRLIFRSKLFRNLEEKKKSASSREQKRNMRNRLAIAHQEAQTPHFGYEDDNDFSSEMIMQSEESSINSALTGTSSNNSVAPSALRKGKYSRYPYARSDIDSDGNNSLGSSISSYHSYTKSHYRYRYNDSPVGEADDVEYHQHQQQEQKHSADQSIKSNVSESKSSRSAVTPYSSDHPLPSHILLRNGVTVGATGYILARHTRFSILFKKKWKELIWVHCKPATIIFFASKKDCLKWMKKKHLANDEKKKLIKHAIDFDTMGVFKGKSKDQISKPLSPTSANIMKYNMTDVRSKRESVDGSFSHRFTLDRWKNSGTSVEIVFCSSHVMEVKQLRKAIRKCLKKVSASTTKKHRSHEVNMINGTELIDDALSLNAQSETSGRSSRASSSSINSQSYSKGKHTSRSRKIRRHRL